jgi:hypothetical protein
MTDDPTKRAAPGTRWRLKRPGLWDAFKEWVADRDHRRIGTPSGGGSFRWPWSRLASVKHLRDAGIIS